MGSSGSQRILALAERGDAEGLRRELPRGKTISHRELAVQALEGAARGGHADSVQLLLDAAADPNAVYGKDGATPLYLCCNSGVETKDAVACARLLLDRKANVNARTLSLGLTPLCVAAHKDDAVLVGVLIEHGANVNASDCNGSTPLYWAAFTPTAAVTQVLLDARADPDRAYRGATPLKLAAQFGHMQMVRVLVEGGASIAPVLDAKSRAAPNGTSSNLSSSLDSPLGLPRSNTGFAGVAALRQLDGSVSPGLSRGGLASWSWGKKTGTAGAFGGEKTGSPRPGSKLKYDFIGLSAYEVAKVKGKTDVSRYLFEKTVEWMLENKADFDAPNEKQSCGDTPLIDAAFFGSANMARLILDSRASVNATNAAGVSPLLVAAKEGATSCSRLLLDRKADVNKCDNSGQCPLSAACAKGHTVIVQLLLERKAQLEPSATQGHDVVAGHCAQVPLLVAAAAGRIGPVRALVEARADILSRDQMGRPAAQCAAEAKRGGIVDYLDRQLIKEPVTSLSRMGSRELAIYTRSKPTLFPSRVAAAIAECGCDGFALVSMPETKLLSSICQGKRDTMRSLLKTIATQPSQAKPNQPEARLTPTSSVDSPQYSARVQREVYTDVEKTAREDTADQESDRGRCWLFNEADITRGRSIGSGNFSIVFEAKISSQPGRPTVIKIPKGHVDPADVQREFLNFSLLGRQRNLVDFIGLVNFGGKMCILQENCERGSLDKLHDKLDLVDRFNSIARDLLLALAHLLAQNFVHRDVACRNLLMRQDGSVVLCDLGLATLSQSEAPGIYKETNASRLPLLWMPPEVIAGPRKFSHKTDIWQAGVTLWEVLTRGDSPYGWAPGKTVSTGAIASGETKLHIPASALPGHREIVTSLLTFRKQDRPDAIEVLERKIPNGLAALKNYGSREIAGLLVKRATLEAKCASRQGPRAGSSISVGRTDSIQSAYQ